MPYTNKDTPSTSIHYRAYLLRFWNEGSADPQTRLRITLIDLCSGKQWGFASLERLFDFLKNILAENHGAGDT